MPLPEKDIFVFLDVTLTYLNKLTGNEITLRDPTIEFQSLVFSAYTGLIQLSGRAEGFVYLTTSQQFLLNLAATRPPRSRVVDDTAREIMKEVSTAIAQASLRRLAPAVGLSHPRLFSTVPDDPIEMPPAVFVQPLIWRQELIYLVLGLSSPETT